MSGDFAVEFVVVEALNRLRVRTTVSGEGVDAADPGDLLTPGCWSFVDALSTHAPALIESLSSGPTSTEWRLYLANEMAGPVADLGLTDHARAALGHATDTTPLRFAIPIALPVVDAVAGIAGADLASPLVADLSGDLSVAGAYEAFRNRVRLILESAQGAFKASPELGRTVQPKRNYGQQQLRDQAVALKAQILQDPYAKSCSISISSRDHLASFDIYVVPISGVAFTENFRVTAGLTA